MVKPILLIIPALFLTCSVMAQEQGSFSGPVGTEGCTAIKADSSAIVAWATGVSVVRGRERIDVANAPLASFGDDEAIVLGQASNYTTDAISLGDGGSATLTFAAPIRNGEGPDFAVFENAIQSNQTGGYFLELAFVEVSSDGERFVRFPAVSLTPTDVQVGTFGEVDPTNLHNLAGKHIVGYGTPFDLEELVDSTGIDVNAITHVRVVDVVGCIDSAYATYDSKGHIVNDPWPTPFASSGFDLTGVAVLHQVGNATPTVDGEAVVVYPNPTSHSIRVVGVPAGEDVLLRDAMGRVVLRSRSGDALDMSQMPVGVYFLQVGQQTHRVVRL